MGREWIEEKKEGGGRGILGKKRDSGWCQLHLWVLERSKGIIRAGAQTHPQGARPLLSTGPMGPLGILSSQNKI